MVEISLFSFARLWRMLSILLVLHIVCGVVMLAFWIQPVSAKPKACTTRSLSIVRAALVSYHEKYGRYPTSCADYGECIQILDGLTLRDDNPQGINFLESGRQSVGTSDLLHDGWGRPFLLILKDDGTNLIVRSVGRNGIDDGGKYDDSEINTSKF